MKISTREDIQAPKDAVFAAVTDFARIEALIAAKGVAISATPEGQRATGTRWTARYDMRGREMETAATLEKLTPGAGYVVTSLTGGVSCEATVDVLEVSEVRTRLFVALDFRPTTLGSRILLQSLKLAKPRIEQKFSERVARFAASIEADQRPVG